MKSVVDLAAPGVDGPALADRVGVDMAVEQQALAAAGPAQAADGVDALAGTGVSSASRPSACICRIISVASSFSPSVWL
jgi:hypothetical protein